MDFIDISIYPNLLFEGVKKLLLLFFYIVCCLLLLILSIILNLGEIKWLGF